MCCKRRETPFPTWWTHLLSGLIPKPKPTQLLAGLLGSVVSCFSLDALGFSQRSLSLPLALTLLAGVYLTPSMQTYRHPNPGPSSKPPHPSPPIQAPL